MRVDRPGLQGQALSQVRVERQGAVGGRLLRCVGAEDLEVGVGARRPAGRNEADKIVRCPSTRVLSTGDSPDSGEAFEFGDPGFELGHRDDEVVKIGGNRTQIVHDPPGPFSVACRVSVTPASTSMVAPKDRRTLDVVSTSGLVAQNRSSSTVKDRKSVV